jgi:hypothetical protein
MVVGRAQLRDNPVRRQRRVIARRDEEKPMVDPEETAREHLAEVIADLSRPEAYPYPVDVVEIEETHASVVFLAGGFVYKVKKPVDFGFLDFSTLERRRFF